MANNFNMNIPKEKFNFAKREGALHDKKFDTKPISYLRDAFNRFKKNKGSIFGFGVVLFLFLYAIIGPFCFNQDYLKSYETKSSTTQYYQYLPPKLAMFEGTGFWDGTQVVNLSENTYYSYVAMAKEIGLETIVGGKYIEKFEVEDSNGTKTMYKVRLNKYNSIKIIRLTLTTEEYEAFQAYQNETGRQLILPWVDYYTKDNNYAIELRSKVLLNDKSVYYECDAQGTPTFQVEVDENGNPVLDENGNPVYSLDENGNYKVIPYYRTYNQTDSTRERTDDYKSIRLASDPGYADPNSTERWIYANKGGGKLARNYTVRVSTYEYFRYVYGFEPAFAFGSDALGYDVFTRLASGARFSLLFAVCVAGINLVIGAIYGAIEGYYGGTADLVMERIVEILGGIPSMVVTVLFNLHLVAKVGVVPSLLYAFIFTGWIGMAGRTRMQFYRFKNQEYVLAARTLGARDRRIMFKHIFPNSLGTIITGSVLAIPGVIFSETSLTYLGIINLDTPTRSSVGAMLSSGQGQMMNYPHLVLFPALFIGLLMVCFNLFGNGLRDAFNPSLRGVED